MPPSLSGLLPFLGQILKVRYYMLMLRLVVQIFLFVRILLQVVQSAVFVRDALVAEIYHLPVFGAHHNTSAGISAQFFVHGHAVVDFAETGRSPFLDFTPY